MKSLNLRSLQLALLAAAIGLTACKKPLTYVHVKILPAAGGEPAAISDVQLDLDLAGKKTTVHLANGSAPIQFPTDVTLEVKTGAGQLAIIAICKNASGAEVDRATGTVQVSKGTIAEESLQLPGGKPDVQPTEASYQFGNVAVGTSSATLNATFHNTGFKPSGPASVALGGVGAAAWVIVTDGCSGSTVPAGGDCTVSLQFQPVTAGAQAATLTFSANPGGSPVIALTGTGLLNPQNLAVTPSGNGTGTVQCAVNGGVATDCAPSYNFGDSVVLTAVAHSPDSQFSGWSGGLPACAGTGTCALTMNQPQSVTPDFTLVPETLTLASAGNGSGSFLCSVNGATSVACTSPTTFNYGDTVVVTGSPSTSSNFTIWTGCDSSSTNTCTLNMIASKSVTATFTLKTVTVTITGAGNGTGKVTSSTSASLSCTSTAGTTSGTCTAAVNYGTTFMMSAAPATSSNVGNWSVTACGAATSCSFSVTSNQTVIATFALKTFAVSITKNGTGKVTSTDSVFNCTGATCTANYNYGSSVTLNPAASSGGILLSWAGGCAGTANGKSCVISNITAAQSVTANFAASLCRPAVAYGESFSASMQGCPEGAPTSTFANRSCGAGAHVCNSNEWVHTQNQGAPAPTHHYWTDDALNYPPPGSVACGPSSCGASNCFATLGTGGIATSVCGATTPMHVCAGTGGTVNDPEGNLCEWTGCGFNSIAPRAYFGVTCQTTAGTLCCSNSLHQYYVATSGNDSNPGTSGSPFKTITKALSVALSGETVFVNSGIYDLSNTETFPLVIPAGVSLIGDEASRGNAATPTKIIGCGTVPATSYTAAVVADAGSMLAGFVLTCSTGSTAVYPRGDAVNIRNNTFSNVGSNNSYGIEVLNSSTNHFVGLNTFTGNFVGLGYQSAATGGKVENNSFTGNQYGLVYNYNSANLGDPANATLSVGNNLLSCNTNADLYLGISGVNVQAAFNKWDHLSPTVSSSSFSNQIDIYNNGSTVNSNSASQAPAPCLCATGSPSQQIFDSAMTGCGASGASIDYASRANLCQAGCHACSANDWVTHYGGIAPSTNYWTGDKLYYNSAIGTGSNNSCGMQTTPAAVVSDCGGFSDLICPNGSRCNLTGCGLGAATPQFFGGCSQTAGGFGFADGTLCCCP